MKEFDNISIERLAKTEVDEFFTYTGFVRPYIAENDKTPVWDGNLLVYSQKREMSNDTLLFKIPLQLKGEEYPKEDFPDKTYYQISGKELELYKNDGGVLFIKVLIVGRKRKIYYNFLTKHKLNSYISSLSGKSRSVRLNPLSEDISGFINEATTFHIQQKHTPVSPLELKDKSFKVRCNAAKLEGENDRAFIVRNQKQLIIKVEGLEGEFYLDCEDVTLKSPENEARIVSIDGIELYTNITRIYEPERVQTLKIGKSLSISIISRDNGVNYNFSLTLQADNFDELIHELRFLVALGKSKSITMDGVTLKLPQLDNKNEIFGKWKRSLKFWEDAKTLFQMLHVYEKLEINELEDNDYTNLRKLIQAILYNKTLTTEYKQDHLERTIVGNLNIVMLVRLIGKKECKLENLQDSLFAAREDANGQFQPVPVLSKILNERPLQSNINFDSMIEDYDKFFLQNPTIVEAANEDVLLLLTHFDEKRTPILIEKANELCNWLQLKNDNPIYFLNHLQIKYRLGETYTVEEKEKLYTISENDSSAINRWAACIILGEYNRAERYWRKMSSNDKVIYVQYPIFKLVPDDLTKPYIEEINKLLSSPTVEERTKEIC